VVKILVKKSMFIIAEVGSNHDRSIEKAIRLIDVAAEACADAINHRLPIERLRLPRHTGG